MRTDHPQLISLLTRLYMDILAIEQEFSLTVGSEDFRPRIEYFHDAVRAYSAQNAAAREPGGRLSVEMLAYDLQCMRYILAMPLSSFKPQTHAGAPSTALVKAEPALVTTPKRPDRLTRERIVELYQHYAVLFAALLKPLADRDYHDRTQDTIEAGNLLSRLLHQMELAGKGKITLSALNEQISYLDDTALRNELAAFLQQAKRPAREEFGKVAAKLKKTIETQDKTLDTIDRAHRDYAMAQLAIYENSQALLKTMASQGMNLIGQFVENSVAQTRRDMGR